MSKVKLKIGHLGISDHLILGMTKYKLEHGLEQLQHSEVECIPMSGWNEVGDAISKGDVDVTLMLIPYAMDLFGAGQKIKLALLGHRSGSVIVANKSANIKKFEDFKGKTVLIPYQLSVHNMLFHKMLKGVGLEPGVGKDVQFEVVAPAQIPMAIEYDPDGYIGGYIVAEPFGTTVINAGRGELLKMSKDIWPEHPCCGVVVRDEIAEKYPEAIAELIDSLVKSGLSVKTDPELAIQVGTTFLKQPEPIIREILTNPIDRVTTDRLYPVLEDLDIMQSYLVEMRSMTNKIDLEKFVNPAFAAAANAAK